MRSFVVLGLLTALVTPAFAGDEALTAKEVDAYLAGRAAAKSPKERAAFDEKAENARVKEALVAVGSRLLGQGLDPAKLDDAVKKLEKKMDDAVLALEKAAPESDLAKHAAAQADAVKAMDRARSDVVTHRIELEAAVKRLEALAADDPAAPAVRKKIQDDIDAATTKKNAAEDASIDAARLYERARRDIQDARDAAAKARAGKGGADPTEKPLAAVQEASSACLQAGRVHELRVPRADEDKEQVALVKERLAKVRPIVAEGFAPEVAALFK